MNWADKLKTAKPPDDVENEEMHLALANAQAPVQKMLDEIIKPLPRDDGELDAVVCDVHLGSWFPGLITWRTRFVEATRSGGDRCSRRRGAKFELRTAKPQASVSGAIRTGQSGARCCSPRRG